jgi:hypothetical protein
MQELGAVFADREERFPGRTIFDDVLRSIVVWLILASFRELPDGPLHELPQRVESIGVKIGREFVSVCFKIAVYYGVPTGLIGDFDRIFLLLSSISDALQHKSEFVLKILLLYSRSESYRVQEVVQFVKQTILVHRGNESAVTVLFELQMSLNDSAAFAHQELYQAIRGYEPGFHKVTAQPFEELRIAHPENADAALRPIGDLLVSCEWIKRIGELRELAEPVRD